MGKTFIEICMLSGEILLMGAGFGCSLLKHQWYAIGWIDPREKYHTTTDASRSGNPLWGTKFTTSLDEDDDSKIQAALHVEVYRIEPIFLTKKLHGSVTVSLKEIFAKYKKQSSSSSVFEDTTSWVLRKENSSKSQGLVKVMIRISAERQESEDLTGVAMLSTNSIYNTSGQNYMTGSSQHPIASANQPNSSKPFSIPPDNHHSSVPNPLTNNASPQMQQPYCSPPSTHQPYYPPPIQQSYYPPPPMQPPPPPSSQHPFATSNQPNSSNSFSVPPDNHHFPMPDPLTNNVSPQTQHPYYPLPPMQQPYYPPPPMQQPYYPPPPMQQPYYPSAPPLPPPTSNSGYMPRSDNAVNVPSSSSSSEGYARPGSAGLGAGKIAAGDPAFHGRDVYLT